MSNKILLIGLGNMMAALLKSWLDAGAQSSNFTAVVSSPESAAEKQKNLPINILSSVNDLPHDDFDVIIFATKPQQLAGVIEQYQHLNPHLVISILAGVKTDYFKKFFECDIARVMPNMGAKVGRPISSVFADISDESKDIIESLFKKRGKLFWLEQESDMHAATAIAGSGPAFLLQIYESFIASAKEHGLSDEVAEKMVLETAHSLCHLVSKSDESLQELIAQVTSKGGTTEAGLEVLKSSAHKDIIAKTISAAAGRSSEISKQLNS